MKLDVDAVFDLIKASTASDRPVGECMRELIDLCATCRPHPDWQRLASLDYDGDVASLSSWIPDVFSREPAPFPVRGLWFGLHNPSFRGTVWADMYVAGLSQYNPGDPEFSWIWDGDRHFPQQSDAQSSSLRSIYEIGYGGEQALENDAEWPLCLGFATTSVRWLLSGQTGQIVGSKAAEIGVAVGFDSGDLLQVGRLTPEGFVIDIQG